ncbi:MAG: calcium-translocating P-type ATPase, PMCA-type [Clostridia bacterium]|nr:calcium-translocating P-type ATPase, PMCA-type [Clostridia bacterium]
MYSQNATFAPPRRQERSGGLTSAEALRSWERFGSNSREKKKRRGFFGVLISGFGDPIIRILLGAVLVNLIFTWNSFDLSETVGILIAVAIAVGVSAVSEYRSESAFEKLKDAGGGTCTVIRDGAAVKLPADELVVGDRVILAAGSRVPADGTLISGAISVDQSAINGESREVSKRPGAPSETPDPKSPSQLFSGTAIRSGSGVMEVGRVGAATLYGKIAEEVQSQSPPSPMKKRLGELAKTVSRVGYAAAAVVGGVRLAAALTSSPAITPAFVWRSFLDALTFAVTVLVVAVPEGLPMMITVVLSSNMKRMLKDKVLVRKAVGIETAGSMNLLFTDKTGTLTEGKMSLEGVVTSDGKFRALKSCPALAERLALSGFLDSSAVLGADGRALGSSATDRAVLEGVAPFLKGKPPEAVAKLGFDSDRKFSAAWDPSGRVYVKGAPDRLLPRVESALNADAKPVPFERAAFAAKIKALARSGKRILLACEGEGGVPGRRIPDRLAVAGALVLADRVRSEAPDAVATVRGAGVQVVMVTGDDPDTAAGVARECGIIRCGAEESVLTGAALDDMSDAELSDRIPGLRVIARAVPAHKSRLVRLARERGLVVGMTGDGINDAAALKCADVGFAMGSGSEIAREAADVVITDDRFASIVKAILYGRTIFKSIRKFVMFQFTMNLCAVGIGILAPLFGVDQPITVLQMLWVNVIMDTLGGIAFAGEAARESYMREPPKKRGEPIVNRAMIRRILAAGLGTLAVCLFFLNSPSLRAFFGYSLDPTPFLTAFFVLFIFAGVFNCFVMRSARLNIFGGITKNRVFVPVMLFITAVQLLFVYFGGPLLRTVPLKASELALAIGAAAAVLPVNAVASLFFALSGDVRDV